MPFRKGDRVRVIKEKFHPRYIGLVGQVVWVAGNGRLVQVETETKPPWYRPANPPWVITLYPNEIEKISV